MDQEKPHALVVGGTGMLKSVCRFLVEQGYQISVIARHEETLNALVEEIGERKTSIHKIALDWNDSISLEKAIQKTIETFRAISLTVAWIHSSASEAPLIVAKLVGGGFFHIRSSSVLDTDYNDPVDVSAISELENIIYHRVVLGSKKEGADSRWLTNDEIATGVIEAITKHAPDFIVGEI